MNGLIDQKSTIKNEDWVPTFEPSDEVFFNSVSKHQLSHWQAIQAQTSNAFQLDRQGPFPFIMDYQTPETLGADRYAHAAWASVHHPGKSCLVVDFGTCLTSTWINSKNQLCGGSISPGMSMRFQALHQYTASLPLLDSMSMKPTAYPGKSTHESISCGVRLGMLAELKELIRSVQRLAPDTLVAITGGDAPLFADYTETTTFVVENLNIEGFYALHKHQNCHPH
ncbi:MAG: type III pantothenate kinase [Flavobacteriales bacterium]